MVDDARLLDTFTGRLAHNWVAQIGRSPEQIARGMLERAGVVVDGSAPHDIQVHNGQFYARVLREGSLGLGEAYMDGWWDCEAIDQFLTRVHHAGLRAEAGRSLNLLLHAARYRLLNLQLPTRGSEIAKHYEEVGADVFEATLDEPWMQYTSGDWRDASTLRAAQEAKLELLCRKAKLREGSTLLDIGCGWGGLAKFAIERHGARPTGVTISRKQVEHIRTHSPNLPIELLLRDYRKVRGRFDAIISCEMLAHVGRENIGSLFEVAERCLAPGGVFVLQFITNRHSVTVSDPWLERYIFHNHHLASLAQVMQASERHFVVEDVHSLGRSYVPTLLAWHERFEAAWPQLRRRYSERFRRMWRYYLLMSTAVNRVRDIGVTQVVFTRPQDYEPKASWRARPQYG